MKIVRYYPRALTGDGGITGAVWHHARELARRGIEVTIAFDEGETPGASDGVSLVPVRHAGRWRVPLEFDHVLSGADLLVLHSAWAYHNVRAADAARRLGVPYLLEPRGAYDPHIVRRRRWTKRMWWWLWERRLVHEARGIHVFFEAERPHLAALGYEGRVVTVLNGVDPPAGSWDGGSGGYVLWMGRFDPEHKGIDLLLEALRLLPADERPPLRLHGPDARIGGKEAMRARVRSLSLEPWVTVGDPVYGEAKTRLMARASGFAYPSRWEAFGNAVAEAAALGVPILATPYPLGRHLAEHGAAILAEARPEALAEGIREIHRPEAAETGRRAADLARCEITWERAADSWLAQVREIL